MASCRPALEKLLKILKPKVILCFGDVAMAQVLKKTGITKQRGRFHNSEEFDFGWFRSSIPPPVSEIRASSLFGIPTW